MFQGRCIHPGIRYTAFMNDVDAFFTHTVVGGPQTVFLGRRAQPHTPSAPGLRVNLTQGHIALEERWHGNMWLLEHAAQPAGRPRRRPGRWRACLERYALLIAVTGLLLGSISLFSLIARTLP